jgi:hypothetical protein
LDRAVAAGVFLPTCIAPPREAVKEETTDQTQQLLGRVGNIAKQLREKGCALTGNADWDAFQTEPKGWQSAQSVIAAFLKLVPTLQPAIRRLCPKDMLSESELMHLSGCMRALGICATALGRLLRRECGAAES